MARYIDSDQLYNAVEQRYRMSSGIEHRCERDLLDLICEQPALSPDDVRGVGEWISERDGSIVELDEDGYVTDSCHCSVCNEHLDGSEEYAVKGNYCPNCGAKMEVSEDA